MYPYRQLVMFGDSITQRAWETQHGLGAFLQNAYQRRLDVLNRGFSGYNTKWALPILEQIIPREKNSNQIPLMTIWFGANDACVNTTQEISAEEFKQNLTQMLTHVSTFSPETKLILLTPTPIHPGERAADLANQDPPRELDRSVERVKEFVEVVKLVGHESKVPVLDAWTLMDKASNSDPDILKTFLCDGLHYNDKGYEIVLKGSSILLE